MRRPTRPMLMAAVVLGMFGVAGAQTKQPPSELKIQVVFSEFDGDKKIASLPYRFVAVGGENENDIVQYQASLRLGISVPILIQTKEGGAETHYEDVGTNIDCRARRYPDGRYKLTFNVERSSVYSSGDSTKGVVPADTPPQPLLRRYRGAFDLLLRDGQTAEGPVATDPQSGRVLKTEVTLNVTR